MLRKLPCLTVFLVFGATGTQVSAADISKSHVDQVLAMTPTAWKKSHSDFAGIMSWSIAPWMKSV